MKELFVYADFDWLETPQLIGELSCNSGAATRHTAFRMTRNGLQNTVMFSQRGFAELHRHPIPPTGARYIRVFLRCSPSGLGEHIAEPS